MRNRIRACRIRLGGCAVLLLAGLLLGCGSSPTPRFYTINAVTAIETAGSANASVAVAVGPITIPRYLQRPQIVSRTGDSRLRYDEFNRWGGSLESEVLRVLGENLGQMLGTERIVVYPRRAPFPIDYSVRVDFERLDAQRGEALVLKARWVVLPAGGGDALAVESTTVREPLDGSGIKELVRAHGAALEVLSRALADRLQSL